MVAWLLMQVLPLDQVSRSNLDLGELGQSIPVDFGVKTAAEAAFGEIPRALTGCALFVTGDRGLKDGESTFRKRLALYSHEYLGEMIIYALRTFLLVDQVSEAIHGCKDSLSYIRRSVCKGTTRKTDRCSELYSCHI
jgi:hypothetical protein